MDIPDTSDKIYLPFYSSGSFYFSNSFYSFLFVLFFHFNPFIKLLDPPILFIILFFLSSLVFLNALPNLSSLIVMIYMRPGA